MTQDSDLLLTRPLTTAENLFRLRTINGFYVNFQVTATYSKSLADLDLFASALRQVFLDYHVLACNVFPQEPEFVIAPLDSVTVGDVLEDCSARADFLTDGRINEKFMKYANSINFELYSQKPLFRLILLPENNLSIVLEHTLADGLVASYFHEIFVKYLAQTPVSFSGTSAETELFSFQKDKALITHSLPPPIDDYLEDYNLPYHYDDPNFYDKWKPEGYERWQGRFPNQKGKTIAFKLVNFTPEQTKQILAKCKQEKITLTIFIELVHAVSFRPVFKEQYTAYRIAMAVRKQFSVAKSAKCYHGLFEPGYKMLGNSASLGLAQNLPPLDEIDWDFARRINGYLIQSAQNPRLLNLSKPFLDVYDPASLSEDFFASMLGKPKQDTAKVSNLGYTGVPVYEGGWTINDIIFSQDMSCTAADFMVNVISSGVGGLNVVISYFDSEFEAPFADFDGLVADFARNMVRFS